MPSLVSLVLATTATVHAAKNGRALNAAENARSAAYQTCYDNEFASGGVRGLLNIMFHLRIFSTLSPITLLLSFLSARLLSFLSARYLRRS